MREPEPPVCRHVEEYNLWASRFVSLKIRHAKGINVKLANPVHTLPSYHHIYDAKAFQGSQSQKAI